MADTLDNFLQLVGKDRQWFNGLSFDDQQNVRNQTIAYDNPPPGLTPKRAIADGKKLAATIDRKITSSKTTTATGQTTSTYQSNPATVGSNINSAVSQLTAAGVSPDQISIYQQAGMLTDPTKVASIITNQHLTDAQAQWGLSQRQATQRILINRGYQPTDVAGPRAGELLRQQAGLFAPPQYDTILNAIAAPQNWSGAAVTNLQQRLIAAGLLDPSKPYTPGAYDQATWTAYERVLDDAGTTNKTPDELIGLYTKQFTQSQIAQKNTLINQRQAMMSNPYVLPAQKIADPAEVQATIQKNFQANVGRNATPQELQAMAGVFREYENKQNAAVQQEGQYQKRATDIATVHQFDIAHQAEEQKYGVSTAGTPGMPAPPVIQQYNPTAEVAAAERSANPMEAGGVDLRGALDGFIQAIRGA